MEHAAPICTERLRRLGSVNNLSEDLEMQVEGSSGRLDSFLHGLEAKRPRAAAVMTEEVSRLARSECLRFEILPAADRVCKTAAVFPDRAAQFEC